MPSWIHDRAKHLREKNPDMPESQSWAVATQQAYAAGKAPKSYGTKAGRREAKAKYDEPKSHYKKVADPGSKSKTASHRMALLMGFADELEKISFVSPKPSLKPPKVISKPVSTQVPDTDPLSNARQTQAPPVVN